MSIEFNRYGRPRLPSYLRKPLGNPRNLHEVKRLLRTHGLHTVCEEARCPNIGECFSKPTATFMILGRVCARRCGFCNVEKAEVLFAPDPLEPRNIASAAKALKLKHVVITSVTRDDLSDGGALQFALTIREIKDSIADVFIEVLTPDFKGDIDALNTVLDETPHIFNHNLETVESLYSLVRPQADYIRSLLVLETAKHRGILTKSGIMLGLGEKPAEVLDVIKDMADAGVDIITIGQYLSPTGKNLDVKEYVSIEKFKYYEEFAKTSGIKFASSGPFVRSSYNAEEVFKDIIKVP